MLASSRAFDRSVGRSGPFVSTTRRIRRDEGVEEAATDGAAIWTRGVRTSRFANLALAAAVELLRIYVPSSLIRTGVLAPTAPVISLSSVRE